MFAEVRCSCGRYFLDIAGVVVAMQGDPCRAELPEEYLEVISSEELNRASIGGKPANELPLELVRFFRGGVWTKRMLEHVADVINNAAAT